MKLNVHSAALARTSASMRSRASAGDADMLVAGARRSGRTIFRLFGAVGLALALGVGAWLRLAHVEDMEYKADERGFFETAVAADWRDAFPWSGYVSSASFPNPGMSLWIFSAPARLLRLDEPTELTRVVQVSNVLALILLVVFIHRNVPAAEREAWYWGAALVAVNPVTVVFHRKLWNSSILPIVCLAFLWGWWRRERPGRAFVWGLVGAAIGQIHPSGFFLAGGFLLWTLLFERRRPAWRWWSAGTAAAAWPLLPWLFHVAGGVGKGYETKARFVHLVDFRFWRLWLRSPTGQGVDFAIRPHLDDFFAYPMLGGRSTGVVYAAQAAALVAASAILALGCWRLWRNRQDALAALAGRASQTSFAIAAAAWGCGGLFTASLVTIHRHHLCVLFPLEFIWIASLGVCQDTKRVGRLLLFVMVASQAIVSASFVNFIHDHPQTAGEYGVAYRAQVEPPPMPLRR